MGFWKNRPLIIAVIFCIILFVLLLSTSGNTQSGGASSAMGRMLAPVQRFLYSSTESIGDFFAGISNNSSLKEENAALKEQVAEMESELRDYENLRQENERLKDLLGVVDSYGDYEKLTARVIGKSPGAWFDEFTINAGEKQGVQKDMIVYTSDGLLGKVVYTSATYSRVISLIHDKSGVSAMVERTRDNGVIKVAENGEDPSDLQLFYLSMNSDVKPGDRIITSGIGGVYPKGIPIAQVTEVSTDSSSEKVVIARSNVDFEHVEEVVVILQLFEEVPQ